MRTLFIVLLCFISMACITPRKKESNNNYQNIEHYDSLFKYSHWFEDVFTRDVEITINELTYSSNYDTLSNYTGQGVPASAKTIRQIHVKSSETSTAHQKDTVTVQINKTADNKFAQHTVSEPGAIPLKSIIIMVITGFLIIYIIKK